MASKRKTAKKHKPTQKNKWRDVLRALSHLATLALSLVRLVFFLYDRYHH